MLNNGRACRSCCAARSAARAASCARRATRFLTGHRGFLSTSALMAPPASRGASSTRCKAQPAPARRRAGRPQVPAAAGVGRRRCRRCRRSGRAVRRVEPDALRMMRLAVSAAQADGALSDAGARGDPGAGAREPGSSRVVEAELAQPRPLAEIVARRRPIRRSGATLYVLAFTIVRADEQRVGRRAHLPRAARAPARARRRRPSQQLEARQPSTRIDAAVGPTDSTA